jgi:hypothetical protein
MTNEKSTDVVPDDLQNLQKELFKLSEHLNEQHKRAIALSVPNRPEFPAHCRTWARRDFWTLREGLNLLLNRRPQAQDWNYGVLDLWKLAQACIGPDGTLKVINPDTETFFENSKVDKLKVRPADLLQWAEEKGITIPAALSEAVHGRAPITAEVVSPVLIATQAKQDNKARRIEALTSFLSDMEQKAKNNDLSWGRRAIPVTKENFRAVFCRVYPEHNVAAATLADDVTDLGGQFRPGTRSKANNILEKLFPKTKQG